MPRISVQEATDHALVLSAVFRGLALEEFDAALRERNRHLHAFLAEGKLFGRGQKVRNDFQITQRFIGVSDFLGHKSVCLFANNRRRRFE